jgi:hypothetical protein
MIKQTLLLAVLPASLAAHADCVVDAPEIGDIGPGSELACAELEHRFPGQALAVEGRVIHSPTDVSIQVTRDGEPMTVRYRLSGLAWRSDEARAEIAELRE